MLRFRIGRIEISVSFWFFTVIALFVLLGRAVFFLYILFPVLIHETGHLILLRICGGRVVEVRFHAFEIGIVKQISSGTPYHKEILIAAAGIIANLTAALLLYLFSFHSMRTMFLTAANIAVALFNLLPIGDLDGGSIVRLIGERFGGVAFGYNLFRAASFLALTPLFAAAFFLLIQDSPNITLLLVCFYLAGVVIRTG